MPDWKRVGDHYEAEISGWHCWVTTTYLRYTPAVPCCGYRVAWRNGQPHRFAEFHLQAETPEAGLAACEAEVARLRREYAERPRQMTLGGTGVNGQ